LFIGLLSFHIIIIINNNIKEYFILFLYLTNMDIVTIDIVTM